jgi:hypothetical protein
MFPTIEFRYSFIYQEELHLTKNMHYDKEEWEDYVAHFVGKLRRQWHKKGPDIVRYLGEISGLRWKESKIMCYIIKSSEQGPISDPLTIPIQLHNKQKVFTLTTERYIDMLIHELIHNLFIQNEERVQHYFNYLLQKKYVHLPLNTITHIPVHAIHKEVFTKFFSKQRFEEELNACSYYPEYAQAWDVVLADDSKKLIDELNTFL